MEKKKREREKHPKAADEATHPLTPLIVTDTSLNSTSTLTMYIIAVANSTVKNIIWLDIYKLK